MLAESQSWVRPADAIGFGRQTVESLNSRNRVAMLLQPSSVLRTAMSGRGRFSLAPQMLVRRWNAPDEIQLETECIARKGDSPNMATPVAALEDCSLRSMTAGGAHVVAQEASPERLKEFDNILSRGLPRFRRIAMRLLNNREDAEDAVQDAMLSAFKHIADFDGRAQMSTWLTAIVINAVRMQIRRRPRAHMLSLDHSSKEDESATFSEFLVDPRPTPEQSLEQHQLRHIVTQLTGGLRRSQRATLLLRLKNGFSIKETAEILGVPVGTVKAQLARGRAKLIERFHKVTRTPKIEASETRRKTSSFGRRRDREQAAAYLPMPAVLNQQGGCEVWVNA